MQAGPDGAVGASPISRRERGDKDGCLPRPSLCSGSQISGFCHCYVRARPSAAVVTYDGRPRVGRLGRLGTYIFHFGSDQQEPSDFLNRCTPTWFRGVFGGRREAWPVSSTRLENDPRDVLGKVDADIEMTRFNIEGWKEEVMMIKSISACVSRN